MKNRTAFHTIYSVLFPVIIIFFTTHAQTAPSVSDSDVFSDFFPSQSNANAQIISASALPESVTVGDEISLRITLQTSKGTQIIAPETGNGFGNFVVRDHQRETISGSNHDTAVYSYTVSIFKPQNCTIPPLSFLVKVNDSQIDTLYSPSIPINFISVLPQEGEDDEDGELSIRDLKGQQVTGRHSMRWIFWLFLIALLGAAAFYICKRFIKNKGGKVTVIPQKPAYEEAIEAILQLEEKKLVQQGFIKEHVFELSEIFKRYIGRRFNINALEFTTDEMVSWLESSKLTKELRLNTEWFFRTSDPVKFARFIPDSQILQRFDSEVRNFLEVTRPILEVQNVNDPNAKTQKMECVS
ncbi:MAG: BatD family protein [Chitinispirillia bacterium]|nr:BatD family protein [Chitinispirillia bacterium]